MAFYRSSGGGANSDSKLFVLSSISSNSQDSSSYTPTKAIECVDSSRWSSKVNVLSYLEMTPSDGSVCANAVSTYIRNFTGSVDTPQTCTVKMQGYNGSTWVDIETISYLSTEIGVPVIKKFSNNTSYSKYRFNFQDYPYRNSSNNGYCGMVFIALLSI